MIFSFPAYRRSSWLLSSLLVASLTTLAGQSGWNTQHYSTAEGLPDRTVNAVVTDTFGFSWLATETGLLRFDGHRFDRPPFLEELREDAEHIIREMIMEENGLIVTWTGGSDFLQLINSGTNEVARLTVDWKEELTTIGPVHYLLEQKKPIAALYVTSDDRYLIFERRGTGELRTVAEIPLGPAADNVVELSRYLGHSGTRGRLVFAAEQRQIVAVGDQENLELPLPDYNKNPQLLYLDQMDRIWFQADDSSQLRVLLPGAEDFVTFAGLLREDEIRFNKVYEDETGNLIFGMIGPTLTRALVRLGTDGDTEDLAKFLRRESRVISLNGKDFGQLIEMATHGGFYRFTRRVPRLKSTLYLNDPALPEGKYGYVIRGFAQGSDGKVYGNTEGGLWYSFQPEDDYSISTFFPQDESGQPATRIGSGHNLISQGPYIYGNYAQDVGKVRKNFLTRFDTRTGSWHRYEIPKKEAFGRFVLALPDGDLLLFTFRRSDRSTTLFRFDPVAETFREVGEINAGLPRRARSSVQNAIFDERRQLIWIALGNGLFTMEYCAKDRPCYFANQNQSNSEGVSEPRIERIRESNLYLLCLALDPEGNLLLGSYGEGLQSFNPETRKSRTIAFDVRNGPARPNNIDLPSNLIAEILQLDSVHLAITTFNGLVIANRKTKQSVLYRKEDGLPDNEFNRLAAFMDDREEVFLGGVNGLLRTDREALLPKPTGPTPELSRYYFADERSRVESSRYPEPQTSTSEISVPPGNLYFGFDFVSAAGQETNYRTYLKGYDVGYGSVNRTGNVEFLRVPAGKYELYVKAITASGEESARPLMIPVTVLQPWYFRPWFLVLSQLLLIGGGVLLYQNRVRRVRREEAEKRRIGKQLAEMEMKILRQQLNPHFIFNALGAIQHFIQNMRGPAAMEYLADFARLMRMFLESSKQSYIFLIDELKLIKLYVRLEQLRFQQRFDVVYDIDPELDLEMEDIPSLLLQPFVENAINHGLFHLRRRGTLTIGMHLDDRDRIVCTVSDDGIGRKAAAELRENTFKKHKSRATQIVAERLEIFQRDTENEVKIRTEDLYPDREETGTKVTVIVDNGE